MWARLDGCILDKIPWASVSGASWAGRGGQSCCIQLRILDITVLVAWVLETREVKCVWGVRQPKQIDIYERVREKQIDTVSKSGRDGWDLKKNKQKPKTTSAWASDGHGEDLTEPAAGVRKQGGIRVCQTWQTWRRHTENNGQRENMGKEMKGQRWRRTCFFLFTQWHLCYSGYDDTENSSFVVHFIFILIILCAFFKLKSEKTFPPVKVQMISSNTKLFMLEDITMQWFSFKEAFSHFVPVKTDWVTILMSGRMTG